MSVADSVPSLEIRLFGAFTATVGGAPLPALRTRKGQWLLALLALFLGAAVERASRWSGLSVNRSASRYGNPASVVYSSTQPQVRPQPHG